MNCPKIRPSSAGSPKRFRRFLALMVAMFALAGAVALVGAAASTPNQAARRLQELRGPDSPYRKAPQSSGASATWDIPTPYPPSKVITGITFHDATARVLAPGSDIWPLSWAADGHQYTCWGDGGGFGGSDKKGRVSFGVGRIKDGTDDYVGVDIAGGMNAPHPAPFSGKSTGILALGDTLYLWLTGSAATRFDFNHLYRSDDHGVTWKDMSVEFSGKSGDFTGLDAGFFSISFCQFGQGYAGARDNYLYMYAPEIMDRSSWDVQKPGKIALIRVDKNQLVDKKAYRFFAGLDEAGQPRWTSDITTRKPVWQDAIGGTHRMAVSYNVPLKRYLLTSIGIDRVGCMAVYDAPEPWGPWTTVYREKNTDRWGSKTILFTFANKWLSADGRRFVIVHTKDDSWASIHGEFTLAAGRIQK